MMPYYDMLQRYWFVVCESRQVRAAPVAYTVLNTPLVFCRLAGKIVALLDACPHRGAPLSHGSVKGEFIVCPYHGWRFDGEGECQHIPGRCNQESTETYHAVSFPTQEKYGFIWVCLADRLPNEESCVAPPFMDDENYYSFIWKTRITGELVNVLENFLDGTHTNFVHKGLIRKDKYRQHIKVSVQTFPGGVEAQYTGEQTQSGIISRLFEKDRKESLARFILPAVVQMEYRSHSGTTLAITAYVTPMTEFAQQVHAVISVRKGWLPGVIKRCLIYPFFALALWQDKKILNLQHANLQRLKHKTFISTENDIMRASIVRLLQDKVYKMNRKTTNIDL